MQCNLPILIRKTKVRKQNEEMAVRCSGRSFNCTECSGGLKCVSSSSLVLFWLSVCVIANATRWLKNMLTCLSGKLVSTVCVYISDEIKVSFESQLEEAIRGL